MDRCLYPDGVFMSKEVHTDNTRQYLDRNRTDRQRAGSRQKNPDRQTPDSIFSKNPDRIQTADKIETDRTRTDRHRTACFPKIRTESGKRTESRQTESGQTDTWQKILTESGQRTDTGQDFPENPDKNETRTGHGQCCPPTSASKNTKFIIVLSHSSNFREIRKNNFNKFTDNTESNSYLSQSNWKIWEFTLLIKFLELKS